MSEKKLSLTSVQWNPEKEDYSVYLTDFIVPDQASSFSHQSTTFAVQMFDPERGMSTFKDDIPMYVNPWCADIDDEPLWSKSHEVLFRFLQVFFFSVIFLVILMYLKAIFKWF